MIIYKCLFILRRRNGLYNIKILSLNNEKIIKCEQNTNLLRLLLDNGYNIPSFCGGNYKCKKCKVRVNSEIVLSCEYFVNSDVTVELINDFKNNVTETFINEIPIAENLYSLILDIGTSTISFLLFEEKTKCPIYDVTIDNPQKIYGSDVISRIKSTNLHGIDLLRIPLLETINSIINKIKKMYSINSFNNMIVSANSVMTHIFLGVSPEGLGSSPYKMNVNKSIVLKGEDIGLDCVRNVRTINLLHSFFGGDALSGLTLTEIPQANNVNLFLDLGTNAEISLLSNEKIYCTSAASGPCFEGGNISIGSNFKNGAIYSYSLKNGENIYKTVSNVKPQSITGTALIDCVSEFLKNYIIDENGTFYDVEEFEIANNLFLTQKDVREFQNAKSAIKTAIDLLLKKSGRSVEHIETVYISGGFSESFNIENAKKTGLLPNGNFKTVFLKNSSFEGAFKCFGKFEIYDRIIEKCEYVDLIESPDFQEMFIKNMNF